MVLFPDWVTTVLFLDLQGDPQQQQQQHKINIIEIDSLNSQRMGIIEIHIRGPVKVKQMMASSPISDNVNLTGLMINL